MRHIHAYKKRRVSVLVIPKIPVVLGLQNQDHPQLM